MKFLDIRLKMVMGMGGDLLYMTCISVYAFMKAMSARSVMPACTHCTNMNKWIIVLIILNSMCDVAEQHLLLTV